MHSRRRELATLTVPVTILILASACSTTQPATPAPATRPAATTRPAAATSPPSLATVYGDLQLSVDPATPAVKPMPGGLTVALEIRKLQGGTVTTWSPGLAPRIKALQFEFRQLPPGRYRLKALDLQGASLSPNMVALPTGGPAFTVPRSGCVYIGLISIAFYRLPPGTVRQQASVADHLAHGKTGYFVYLRTGGFLGNTAGVGSLPARERPAGSQACPVRPAKF